MIVAQLCPEFTARLVDRWQELEAQVVKPVALPTDYLSALKALVASEEEKQHLLTTSKEMQLVTMQY
ncbi:hypothetical protein [Halomonas sp. BC04]|uniref:hypothetical protein n=1 Tax=Halomonas sp. BC04 TaxID=1403540 RepID=UPI0003ED7670|nr:hypothetical protein [Halomonas sp. BC04]EWH02536.1 hypothetical protein Q427_08205 [Halomonas sp. BC04]